MGRNANYGVGVMDASVDLPRGIDALGTTCQAIRFGAHRVLQVGPIDAGMGRYRSSGWLELRDGSGHGDNSWDIEIREAGDS